MHEPPSLDSLNTKLREIIVGLEECARLIRDLDLNKSENIRRVADAVTRVHMIQLEVYGNRPDLAPPSTKPNWGRD